MARGDKNKRGTSERDNKNQNNKRQAGPEQQDLVSQLDRTSSSRPQEQKRSIEINERRFNLLVDGVPYMVTAKPFRFNGEVRYRVSVNEGSEHVFTWDSSVGELRAIDDEASTLPDNVEEAISEKLQSKP